MSVRVEVTVGDTPTEEELAMQAAEAAAAAAKSAAAVAEVPDMPETPLTVIAERPEAETTHREVDLTTS